MGKKLKVLAPSEVSGPFVTSSGGTVAGPGVSTANGLSGYQLAAMLNSAFKLGYAEAQAKMITSMSIIVTGQVDAIDEVVTNG